MHSPVSSGVSQGEPTATVEDYLALIYVFERDGHPAIATRLAEQLGVSLPTATATVKRMVRDGWASVDDRKIVHLTVDGGQKARSVVRRHYLIEAMLRKLLGVPWSQVHKEAHAMEHVISDDTVLRMQKVLENPHTCPHGNPLPGEEKMIAHWVKLSDLTPGESGVIRRIHEFAEDNADLMAFLEKSRLMPGAKFIVRDVMPFNETIALEIDGQPVVLGQTTAQWIYADQIQHAKSRR
ncbi:MAG TPA: metal-dependent transcriptional regulator [Anaerolineae bacterium]